MNRGLLVPLMAVALVSCEATEPVEEEESDPPVITVTVSGPNVVGVGETIELTREVTSTAGLASQLVTWTSRDVDVARVDSDGVVSGVSAGMTSIVAASTVDPLVTASHPVTVTPPVVSVQVSGPTSVSVGDIFELSATVTSSAGAIDQTVEWTSGDTAVARVQPEGRIWARNGGEVSITATTSAVPVVSSTHDVTVRPTLRHVFELHSTRPPPNQDKVFDWTGGGQAIIVDPDGNPDASVAWLEGITLAGGPRGSADYIALEGVRILGPGRDATIELWATPLSVRFWSRIFDIGRRQGGDPWDYLLMSWSQGNDGSSDAIVWGKDGADELFVTGSMSPYSLGTMHHIVLTVHHGLGTGGATLVSWYLDGVRRGSAEMPSPPDDIWARSFWLGRSLNGQDQTANATYREVRLYEGALDSAEVAASFACGPTTPGC